MIMKLVLSSAASAALLDAVIDERGTQVGRYLDAVKPLVLSKSGAAAALTTDIAAGIVRLLDPDAAELLAESTTLQLSGADSSARSADTSERSPGSNGRRPSFSVGGFEMSAASSVAAAAASVADSAAAASAAAADKVTAAAASAADAADKVTAAARTAVRAVHGRPSGEYDPGDISSRLSHFCAALRANARISDSVVMRRFEYVTVLEHAEDLNCTSSSRGHIRRSQSARSAAEVKARYERLAEETSTDGDKESRATRCIVSWPKLVGRMTTFVRKHQFDADATTCTHVLDTLRIHLLAARSQDGSTLEFGSLARTDRECYVQKQNSLDSLGVTHLVAEVLSNSQPTASGAKSLDDAAFALALELIGGGNPTVQMSVYGYLMNTDVRARLWGHLRTRLDTAMTKLHQWKTRVALEYSPPTSEEKLNAEYAVQTCELMRLMCEGHNRDMQDLLREQPHCQSASVNLLAEAVNLLALLVQSGGDCRRADETAVSVIKSVLELLVESLQGPCQGNQHYIVTSANAMNIVTTVLSSPFQRVAEASALRAKGLAVKLIASCLEGRDDHVVHARLADVLELPTLASFAKDLNVKYLPKMRELALEILVDFEHTMVQLNQQGSEKFKSQSETFHRSKDVSQVEVYWHGKCEVVTFPLPVWHDMLTSTARAKFLASTDLASSDTRMKALLACTDDLVIEMQTLYTLDQGYPIYRAALRQRELLKWFLYGLVCLINANNLMAGGRSARGGGPLTEPLLEMSVSGVFNAVVCVVLTFGYTVFLVLAARSDIPILAKQLRKRAESERNKRKQRSWAALQRVGLATLVYWGFSTCHAAHYGFQLWWAWLFVIVMLPAFLVAIRLWIGVPDSNPIQFRFALVFDIITTLPTVRNHLALSTLSFLGLWRKYCTAILLLDIFTMSHTLSQIALAIAKPAPSILMTFYVFVISAFIYSMVRFHPPPPLALTAAAAAALAHVVRVAKHSMASSSFTAISASTSSTMM